MIGNCPILPFAKIPPLGIGIRIGASASYWNQQRINDSCLFFASDNTSILNKVVSTQLPNQVTGAVDFLTVTGSGLNARYRTPDSDTYRTADSDYVFWKTDASESICDGNRLIAYDFPRILVKYLNVAPYTILWIAILKPGVTVTNGMRDAFDLSIWWDNTLSTHGNLKENRGSVQNTWTPESVQLPIFTDGNTIGWYKSDDLSTITKDVNHCVSAWRDYLGVGPTLANAETADKLPIWSADGLAFNPSGSGDYLKVTKVWNKPNYMYIVWKQVGWGDGTRPFNLGAAAGVIAQWTSEPNIIGYSGSLSSLNGNLAKGSFGIMRAFFNGASSKLQINNTSAITGNFGAGNGSVIDIGSTGGSANIIVKEMILRNKVEESGDETAIYNYLATKHGFPTI